MRHFKEFESHLYLAAIGIVLLLAPGCATTQGVRYVYQDKNFGVIGMPENTDEWPTHYRRQAEKLMEDHFPGGHEIVRAEEVIEGSRTLKIEGSKTAEIAPQLPTELLKVAKLGGSSSRSQADTLKLKECRIIYRRVDRAQATNAEDWGPPKPHLNLLGGNRTVHPEAADFSEQAAITPAQYLDPNDAERRKAREAAEPAAKEQKHVVAKPVAEPAATGD